MQPITEEPRKVFVFEVTRLPSPQAQPQPVPAIPSPSEEEGRSWVQRAEAVRLEANESISNMPQPQPAPTSPNFDREDGRTRSERAEAARLEAKESIQRSHAHVGFLTMQFTGPLVAEVQPTGRFIFGAANKEGWLQPPPPEQFLAPLIHPSRARATPASPKGRSRQHRKRRGDGRVALGGARIRKTGRRRTAQRGRQEKLLNKKRTAVSAAEGAAEIARTTQRKMPAPRKKGKYN